MSRMAVYVERNNSFKRSLERQVADLQTELKCRLLQIEQTQYEILKSYGHQIDLIAKYLHTLSPRRRRRLLSEMNLHYTGVAGKSGIKQTMLKHTLSEKDILIQQQKCVCSRSGSRMTDVSDTEKMDLRCELCSFRHRTLMRKETRKHFRDEGYTDSSRSEFKRGISFSDKYLFERDKQEKLTVGKLQRFSSFATMHDHQPRDEPDAPSGNINLTAFAFSRHSLNHNGTPLKRRTFDLPDTDRLKRGIRTKVVQNYLLCDVFKRLSDRNNSLARMKIDGMHEEPVEDSQYTRDVVKNLQKCRYLRVPKSLQEPEDDKMPKIDID